MMDYSAIEIKRIYTPLDPSSTTPPIAELVLNPVLPVLRKEALNLPINALSAQAIQKKIGPFLSSQKRAAATFDAKIAAELATAQKDKSRCGLLLEKTGALTLPSGRSCFLRGSELIGAEDAPFLISPQVEEQQLLGTGESPERIVQILQTVQFPALIMLGFTLMSSVRSIMLESHVDLQAVLYIIGRQGLGKTTLATRLGAVYRRPDGHSCGILQASSTTAAVEAEAVRLRDQVLIVDDLCLSASRDVERKRRDLGAYIVRLGAGVVPVTKRRGSSCESRFCNAGIVITAEFPLENQSDLTRCILLPVTEQQHLPKDLTPELVGDSIRHFSRWILNHGDDFRSTLSQSIAAASESSRNIRVATNYICLREVLFEFLRSLAHLGVDLDCINETAKRIHVALQESLNAHDTFMESLSSQNKAGNLSYVILAGLKNEAFRLKRKPQKLVDHDVDGVIVKDDLCVLPDALELYVRSQHGYHNYTKRMISRELKDIAALRIHKNGDSSTSTVKLDHGLPPVFRISIRALADAAEQY